MWPTNWPTSSASEPAQACLSAASPFSPAAKADIDRLAEDDPRLATRALGLIALVEAGRLNGRRLADLPSYGDLRDCRKIYFGAAPHGRPTHRIVYQQTDAGQLELIEVVAVEERDEGYVYLLAAYRLERLPAESEPRRKRIHNAVVQRRGQLRQLRKRSQ